MLRLHLTVVGADGAAEDVTAELAEEHRIRDLAAALATHRARPEPWADALRCDRLGRVLGPDEPVARSGLVSGDTVRLADPERGRGDVPIAGAAGLVCEVVTGPAVGTALPLSARGAYRVGRDPVCELHLDDPTVSRHHAALEVGQDGRVTITPDDATTNAVVVDGRPIDGTAPVAVGAVVQLGASALVLRDRAATSEAPRDQLGQIPFNRTPYQHPDLSPVEVRGPGDPPAPHEPRPFVVLAALAPVVGAVVIASVLGRWIFLVFAVLSPLTMAANWWSERRRAGTSNREAAETFERRLAGWIERYDAALEVERRRRFDAAPDLADLRRRAELRTYDLWPRSLRAAGFLELRLGLGTLPALTTTPRPRSTEADPDQRIEGVIDEREHLTSLPLTIDLGEHPVCAVHGAPREAEDAVASLVVQVATLHSPDEVVLAVAVAEDRHLGAWVKWLPHVRSVSSPLADEHVAVGTEAATALVRELLEATAERDADAAPRVVLVLDERCGVDAALVAALLDHAPAVGMHVVWLGDERSALPRQASAVVHLPAATSGEAATRWHTEPGAPRHRFVPDRLGPDAAEQAARSLAPVRDVSSSSAAASIPRIAPLLEVLRAPSLTAQDVARAWQRPPRDALDAPLGIGSAGPLVIDLVEHGPHGLIAGTSGAGKSELLQSYIAALIANHPPTRLNLLFIDYKGGASSNVFQAAPHTVGYVTNLGADLAMRALVSLRAELDRRMRLLEGRAKDLGEMLEKHPEEAPASLVIVVDEFATLVKEIPDFVAGMVDIAQRGRSLGIHLILATQRPSGAVNDNILANTNLRISLRVLDPGDSSSILGTPDAAHVPAPLRGRGFAKLGAGALLEFQSAFSGATFTAETGTTPIAVSGFPGAPDEPVTLHPAPPKDVAADARTHLDVLMAAVTGATSQLGMSRGRRPWLEDLPRQLSLEQVRAGDFGEVPPLEPGRDLLVGVRDEPAHQQQRPHVIDLEATGGLLIFGTGGSGRTTTLRTVLGAVVAEASPRDVEVHVLDFAGRTLEALADLPHVAAVSSSDDLERTTRTLQHLKAEIVRRQALLAERRAENLTAYHAGDPPTRLPRLLVLLDGYDTFDRTFDRGNLYTWSEALVEIALIGRAVGVHLVATANRRMSVPAPLMNAIGGRLLLRTTDADALVDLGIPSSVARDARLGDGRALTMDARTVQIALVGGELDNAGQAAALAELGQATGGDDQARLPELPVALERAELAHQTPEAVAFAIGVADLTLATVRCDVRLHHFAVIGPPESGRSTALRTAALGLRDGGADVWVVAPTTSPLAKESFPHVATDRSGHGPLIEELTAAIEAGRDGPVPVLVIDGAEKLDDGAGRDLEKLLADDQVRLMASVDGGTLSGFTGGWLGALKGTRRMLLLQPDGLGDLGMLTPTRIQLRPGQEFPEGRGVLVQGRGWDLIQVAR